MSVALIEPEESNFRVVPARQRAQRRLHSRIIRAAPVTRAQRCIAGPAQKVGAIEMIKRRDSEKQFSVKGVDPGKVDERVCFVLHVAYAEVLRVAIVRHLEEISPRTRYQPKLILLTRFENQGGKAAKSVALIMKYSRGRRCQSIIAPVAVGACVVRKPFRVSGKTDLIIRLIEVTVASQKLRFALAFKSAARHHVENSVSAIAEL